MMAAINTASGNPSATAPMAAKSPRHAGEGVRSPQSRRGGGRAAAGASPWTQIVRGESEPITAEPAAAAGATATASPSPPSTSSSSSPPLLPPQASLSPSLVEELAGESSESGNAGKRHAWNKPSNGGSEVGPVMGAETWPALGETARVSSKSSSESLKGLSDGVSSISISQVSGTSVSTTTSPPKQANTASTTNPTAPVRQRSMRSRSNPNTSSNGVLAQQSPGTVANEPPAVIPPKEHTPRSGVGSHSHGGGDHLQQRSGSFRNRNTGPHQRGDGSHHQSFGGRRDQDRGNHDWNTHSRSFNNRDIQQQRVAPRVYRGQTPPPSPGPFIPNHAMRPYGAHPMQFPGELGPQLVYIAHPPFMTPIQPVFMPPQDPQLPSKIVNQIDYYFSNENLIRDTFLRKNMDEQGWVPIKLIAGFKKVSMLTDNVQFILETMRMSNVVEVQGDRIRRRNEWGRWIIDQSVALENVTGGGQSQSYQSLLSNGDGADRPFSGRN